MKLDILDITGKKKGQIILPQEIFASKINSTLMAQAVRVYLSNQRKAYAKTKTRGEVNVSHHKIWRQKGTGHARHGSKNAPIFVGGAIAHGPRGNQNYKKSFPKKMSRLALFSALTSKLNNKEIILVDGLQNVKLKTKEMFNIFKTLVPNFSSLLIVSPEKNITITQSTKNIPQVSIIEATKLNTYQVLKAGTILFTKESIEKLKQTFLTKNK